jgi:UDP-4-amino-4,6-dideoxy-N-acetyl-beta-L-altrosamine transaminase
MATQFLPYGRQSIDEEDIQAVSQALREEIITRGKHVEAFENALAQQCKAKYAVAFNSGTAALQACYYAAEASPNDRVFSTPNSFFASVGAALSYGSHVVFVDIDRSTGNINLDALEPNLNRPQTRGKDIIVPVHFSGIPVDMARVESMIRNPDTLVIEDAAHALGSTYSDGTPVGSCRWSHMTILSFHPVKNMTTGEGGAVTTNNPELYHKLRRFRNNGIERDPKYMEKHPGPWYYEVYDDTGNYNFTDFQAALGLSQLKKLNKFLDKRRELVKEYRRLLNNHPTIRLFTDAADKHTGFHIFVVQIDFAKIGKSKAQVMEQLLKKGIGTQVHYIPIYQHPRMQKLVGDIAEYFPEMETYYSQALTLPLFYDMKLEDVQYVAQSLKEIC